MELEEVKKNFVGKWKVDRSENFEEFLREVGVNVLLRKLASKAKPEMEIRITDENKVKMTMKTGFMTQEDIFNFNEEFLKTMDGNVLKVMPTWEDGKIKMVNTPVDPSSPIKPQTAYRERIEDEMLITILIGDVVCKRYMKKIGD